MSELVSKKYNKVHTTSAIVQILDLTRTGSSIELEMSSKGEKLGTLVIGRGSFKWYPKHSKKNHVRLDWTTFAEIMKGYGK